MLNEVELEKLLVIFVKKFNNDLLNSLETFSIKDRLEKGDLYLAKAKGIKNATELADTFLTSYKSSSEETIFGDVFEQVAIYIVQTLYGGKKSDEQGMDYEFIKDGITYFIQHKSGPNWGNSSQLKSLTNSFTQLYDKYQTGIKCYNLCSYSKQKSKANDVYQKVCGQETWYLLTGDSEFYKKLLNWMVPDSSSKSDLDTKYQNLLSKLVSELIALGFAELDGSLNWDKLIEHNSGNMIPKPKKVKVKKPKKLK